MKKQWYCIEMKLNCISEFRYMDFGMGSYDGLVNTDFVFASEAQIYFDKKPVN
jgi:hypothetical protein